MHVAALGLQSNVIYLFFWLIPAFAWWIIVVVVLIILLVLVILVVLIVYKRKRDREREALQQGPRIDALELESAKVRDHSFIGH